MEDPRMTVRCVPSAHGDPIQSQLAPSLRKYWDLEFLEPDIIYPDFDSEWFPRPVMTRQLI